MKLLPRYYEEKREKSSESRSEHRFASFRERSERVVEVVYSEKGKREKRRENLYKFDRVQRCLRFDTER